MEVSGFGCNLFWMEREKFVSWIWGKEHNNQTFQRVPLKGQLLDLLLHIFLWAFAVRIFSLSWANLLQNPISSFLKTLTLNDFREPFVLPVIEDSVLDLSDLGLEEVFMTNNEPKVEEEDDVFRPEKPSSPPPPIFPPPPFIPDYQTRLAYSPTIDSKHLFTLDNAPPSK